MKKNKNNRLYDWLAISLVVILAAVFLFFKQEKPMPNPGFFASTQTIDQSSLQTEETYSEMETPSESQIPSIPLELLLGNLDPATNDQFVRIEESFANRSGMFMHREAYEAFVKMDSAAQADGVNLTIVSAMRTFSHQRRIWNDKWNGRQILEGNIRATSIADPVERAREILRFSAMPGTSRHHWGTDIDLNSLVNSYFELGQGKNVYDWLLANASRYGFCQPYTARNAQRPEGYEEEKWHWSYKPLAAKYLSAFEASVQYDHLKGFDGWETAEELKVIENYVLGIDEKCKMKN
ncbi:MAG: M15 family metallopeptidase [Bacteroides sp.]|nr:M15 family metallopeptidase [Bacteroides sp.]